MINNKLKLFFRKITFNEWKIVKFRNGKYGAFRGLLSKEFLEMPRPSSQWQDKEIKLGFWSRYEHVEKWCQAETLTMAREQVALFYKLERDKKEPKYRKLTDEEITFLTLKE